MTESSNNFKQAKEWEEAYLHTRRGKKRRKGRLKKFSIGKDDKVLDLGCGDGLNIVVLRELGITNVVGLDMSENLLEKAKKNNPQTEFYVGTAEELPFNDAKFDVVLVDSVFHHLWDYDKTLKEIYRVLAPGGLLCFIEPHKSILRSLVDFVGILPIVEYIPYLNQRRRSYLREIDLIKHWLRTEDQFLDSLRKNKYRKVFCYTDFLSVIGKYKKIS